MTNIYTKTPLNHNSKKSGDTFDPNTLKPFLSNKNSKNPNLHNVSKSITIYNRNRPLPRSSDKNKSEFINCLKKQKESMINTGIEHNYILVKDSSRLNISNKNITKNSILSPLNSKKISSNKTINVKKNNKILKSFELYNKII